MQTEAEKEGVRLAKEERGIIAHARFAIVVNLMIYYGVAVSIWGLALKASVFWSAMAGIILGLIIAFTFCLSTVITKPRNAEEVRDRRFFIEAWDMFAIIIGILGLLVWVARVSFHH